MNKDTWSHVLHFLCYELESFAMFDEKYQTSSFFEKLREVVKMRKVNKTMKIALEQHTFWKRYSFIRFGEFNGSFQYYFERMKNILTKWGGCMRPFLLYDEYERVYGVMDLRITEDKLRTHMVQFRRHLDNLSKRKSKKETIFYNNSYEKFLIIRHAKVNSWTYEGAGNTIVVRKT